MDSQAYIIIACMAYLILSDIGKWFRKIRKSECFGLKVERDADSGADDGGAAKEEGDPIREIVEGLVETTLKRLTPSPSLETVPSS